MIPWTPLRDRIRLALAVLTGRVYVDAVEPLAWGERITLRTREDERLLSGGSR